MEQNRFQPEVNEDQEHPQLTVAILGFEKTDEDNFIRFFQTNRPDQRRYTASKQTLHLASDILMVNYDNPVALRERDTILSSKPTIPVVAVSRGPLLDPPLYHIRGLLFAARILTTLDKVNIDSAEKNQPKNIQSDSINQHTTEQKQPLKQVSIETDTRLQETSKAPVSEPTKEQKPVTSSAGNYRALVVDDSVAIQKSIEINLSTLPQIGGIDFADSGESALEKAESGHYDLIFLDVMMPGIDGYETCTRLRKNPIYKKTPIIMVSGKTSPLDEVKGVMAGCTTYLTKPVQKDAFNKLSIRILAWLEKQK